MTVRDLIKLLKKCDQNAFVYVPKERESGTDFARTVLVLKQDSRKMNAKQDEESSMTTHVTITPESIYACN